MLATGDRVEKEAGTCVGELTLVIVTEVGDVCGNSDGVVVSWVG